MKTRHYTPVDHLLMNFDQALRTLAGRPLVEHVAERLRPQVGELLISCNRNVEVYAALADATVTDSRRDFQGPLAGLEAAAPGIRTGLLLIAACDTPLLPTDLASRLAEPLLQENGADICYAHDGERDQYLCALLRTGCLDTLPPYLDSGGRTVRHWYAQHRCTAVDFSDIAEAFSNYNCIEQD